MVKPNYSFAKRQREIAKKQKKELKRQQKAETPQESEPESDLADSAPPPSEDTTGN